MQTHLISSQDRFSPKIRQFSAFLSTLGIEALPDSETDFGLASTADVRESVAEMFQRAGLDAAVRPAAFSTEFNLAQPELVCRVLRRTGIEASQGLRDTSRSSGHSS